MQEYAILCESMPPDRLDLRPECFEHCRAVLLVCGIIALISPDSAMRTRVFILVSCDIVSYAAAIFGGAPWSLIRTNRGQVAQFREEMLNFQELASATSQVLLSCWGYWVNRLELSGISSFYTIIKWISFKLRWYTLKIPQTCRQHGRSDKEFTWQTNNLRYHSPL